MKLTTHRLTDRDVAIRIEGRLESRDLHDLETLIFRTPPDTRLVLDLSGLISLDDGGREFLVRMRRSGCHLRGGSLYITRLLEEVTS